MNIDPEQRRRNVQAHAIAEAARKALGQAEAARNQQIRAERDKALSAALDLLAAQAEAAGLTLTIENKALVARAGNVIRGQWSPDKRPTVRAGSIPCCPPLHWLAEIIK